jgi:hypothetical protein
MQITQEQAESLHLLDRDAFIAQLCREVADDVAWVKHAWPPDMIHRMVRYAYDRATIANGFVRDMDISIYVQLFFDVSTAFDQHPAIAQVLHDPSRQPDEKWDTVNEAEFAEVWEEVGRQEGDALLFPETKGNIQDAYPTTHHLPGFQTLYAKMRKEHYYFLEDGESLNAE